MNKGIPNQCATQYREKETTLQWLQLKRLGFVTGLPNEARHAGAELHSCIDIVHESDTRSHNSSGTSGHSGSTPSYKIFLLSVGAIESN